MCVCGVGGEGLRLVLSKCACRHTPKYDIQLSEVAKTAFQPHYGSLSKLR